MAALALFRRVFLAAALAGLCAGVLGWGARQVLVVPLILQAEAHEAAAHAGHVHEGDGTWQPGEGMPRMLVTLVTDMLAAFAFALLLAALILLGGGRIDVWRGVAWGLGGYLAVCLVPSLYLPPELPGTDSGALYARQVWWVFAVVATGAGLLLAHFARHPAWYVAAVLVAALPHLIAAPASHGSGHHGEPPADLAHAFVTAVLVVNAVFWLTLGAATGYFQRRLVAG